MLAAALLSGCAASADPAATSTQAPSLPSSVETAGRTDLQTSAVPGAISARQGAFGLALPAGWRDATADHPDTAVFLTANDPSDKVYPTFSVVRTTMKKEVALTVLVEQGMIAQRQKGATVSKLADRRIGGVPAAGYRMTTTSEKVEVVQTQFFVVRDRTVYITTLTAAAAQDTQAQGVLEQILSSWSWGAPPPLPSQQTPAGSTSSAPIESQEPTPSSTPTGDPDSSTATPSTD